MAREPRRVTRLDQPREVRRALVPTPSYDPDAFGRFSERIARFIGTGRFLVYMTVFVVVWIAWNAVEWKLQYDDYPFILLTLMLSLQASYAAPLILLAQNRQADRDRVQYEQDRSRAERNIADTDYLTRELASLRMAVGDVATRDFLRSELRQLLDDLEERRALGTEPARDQKADAARRSARDREVGALRRYDDGAGLAAPSPGSPSRNRPSSSASAAASSSSSRPTA